MTRKLQMVQNEARRCVELVARFGKTADPEMLDQVILAREKLDGIEETLEAFGYRLGWRNGKSDDLGVAIVKI